MIFTLEALEAHEGDCLVLSWGTNAKSIRHILIDGGTKGIFKGSLEPRLTQLRKAHKTPKDEPLALEMVMVSHVDGDHITGIIELLNRIEKGGESPLYAMRTLWFNSFDDVIGNGSNELKSRLASLPVSAFKKDGEHSAAVVASVGQGRDVRAKAESLGILLNAGFKGLVMAKDSRVTVSQADGLQLHVISPSLARLQKLEAAWEKDVKANPSDAKVAAFVDNSVANLSSIAVVAEFGGKTILLTGDARGDDLLEGLAASGFIDNAKTGTMHFDIIKMPHHGSNRNMEKNFLERITADHYVISADGKFSNPDADTVSWIGEARGSDSYKLYLTNEKMVEPKSKTDIGADVKKVLKKNKMEKKTVFRKDSDLGVTVNLFDVLPF